MKTDVFETMVGALVVAIAAVFFFYTYTTTDAGATTGYELSAKFNKVDGIVPGSDVRMSGIKIGTVSDQELDTTTYLAVLRMTIRSDIALPEDSSIKIASEGLLGGNYISVEPGGAEDMLGDGDEIIYTQGSVNLMDMVGQAIFSLGSGSDESEKE